MAAALTLGQQLEALIERIRTQVPIIKSVVGMEDFDDAMATDERLPAAVVIYSGDYPEKAGPGLAEHHGQKVNRYWSVIVVLELAKPAEALDLLELVNKAGVGWRPCVGARYLAAAGIRFISKFDSTRVAYEVRFATLTTTKGA